MKSLLLKIAAFLVFPGATTVCMAEVIRWPQACLSGDLLVTNSSSTDISGWVQKFNPTLTLETEYDFKAGSLTKVKITADNSSQFFSLFYFQSSSSDLKATFNCDSGSYPANSFEGGLLTFRKTDLDENKLWLQNLFTDDNTVQIDLLNRRFQLVATTKVSLKSMEQKNYKILSTDSAWSYVRVKGTERFAAFNLTSQGSEGPAVIGPQDSSVSETAVYFAVAARNGIGDQFVIQVTDPAMIAKAREQISNPKLEKIVFARIQKGHSGFNRNWSKKEKSFWSWSTTEVTNISDLGSTVCNGFPQAVEDRMDAWIQAPGSICFWGYRIKKELSPTEVASGNPLQ